MQNPEAENETATEFRRDDKGRPIAEDGYPTGGCAHAKEAAAFSSRSLSGIYAMIASGELPSVAVGRTRRVPWAALRRVFSTEE